MNRKPSDFSEQGVFATTERLVLRTPVKGDLPYYIETFVPTLRREYSVDNGFGCRLREMYWDGIVNDESCLCCTVTDLVSSDVCGYVSVEKLDVDPTELGVQLLPPYQGMGLGTEAVSAFMAGS